MSLDDAGDGGGEKASGSTPFSLQVSTSEAVAAQCSAPPSEPAKRAFFRVSAMGRIERSTVLESISIVPLSMKGVGPPTGRGRSGRRRRACPSG